MTRPVVMTVSQATRASGSLARMASRMASEIWSATLSGWPSVTDSDVKRLDIDGPPLNHPRRQGPVSMWTRPQAPGFYLWDGVDPNPASPPTSPRSGEGLLSMAGSDGG